MDRVTRAATLALHHAWCNESKETTEEQFFELHRLSLTSKETGIAVEVSDNLASLWYKRGQFEEAKTLCEKMLKIARTDYRLLRGLAQAEKKLGQVDAALMHYQQSLENCPDDEQKNMASILHNMAIIYASQDQNNKALTLFQRSLNIKESIEDVKDRPATLTWMALIHTQLGDVDEAMKLHQNALDIQENLGDTEGHAATLHNMAGLHAKKGQAAEAMKLYKQSLDIQQRTGNEKGKEDALSQMAELHAAQGEFKEALALYQQLLEVKTISGDVKGKSEILAMMSKLSVALFEQLKTPDVEKVRKLMAKRR